MLAKILHHASSAKPSRFGPARRHRLSWLALLVATAGWALVWSAFVVAAVQGEPWRGWVIGAGFCGGVWSLALGAWWKPRAGGLVMVAAGVWAARFFHSRAAMIGLAAPAISLGLGFVLTGMAQARRTRKAIKAQTAHLATPTETHEADTSP